MAINVDYAKLGNAIDETVRDLRAGAKNPDRARKVSLEVVRDLEGTVSNGEYQFGIDAAIDAGGRGLYARPMDYVLGGLLSCVQMWCLRWAASRGQTLVNLRLRAEGRFTWRGEYLAEVDAGLTAIHLDYEVEAPDASMEAMLDMLATVARRCPVFATLMKAAPIHQRVLLNGVPHETPVLRP
ncbi:MAG TPA: OsmC family protein [Stellaceae bacterium]|nr:OsmC family protein [Stellaceae bacterium]